MEKICIIFLAFFLFTQVNTVQISDYFTSLGLLTVPSTNTTPAAVSPPPTSAPIGPTPVYPANALPPVNTTMPLILVITVCRHGNRTIESTWSNDPYRKTAYWPEGTPDILTDAGKQLAFLFGRFMRNRYASLLGPNYSPSQVYMRSTNTTRTMTSSQYFSAGLLSPLNQTYSNALNNQFVPIVTIPYSTDYLLAQSMACNITDTAHDNYINSTPIQTQLTSVSALRTYLKNNSGTSANSPSDFFSFYDSIHVESMRGLILPNWAANILNNYDYVMEYFVALSYQAYVVTPPMQKTKAGFLLKEIFQHMTARISGQANPNYSYYHYCGHQGTLTNILCALNVFKFDVPSFSSSIHFELYGNGSKNYVQVLYRTDNSKYDLPLVIPGCGGPMCEINTFFQVLSPVIPSSTDTYNGLCQNSS